MFVFYSYVKMSSPNINNVLLVGCIMCYTTVFMKTIEVESASICAVRDTLSCSFVDVCC